MLVVVNANCMGGRGHERWDRVRGKLAAEGVAFDAVLPNGVAEADEAIREGIARGCDLIVAAGGDGTVNAALNAIMDPTTDRPRGGVALGAIGLGSSNDFHKPRVRRRLAGFPARLSAEDGARADVGKARLLHPDGRETIRYFVLNASMGIVAEGNAFFNDGDAVIRRLKKLNTEAAILYAAFTKIAQNEASRVALEVDGTPVLEEAVVNIGVLKSVHFAGGMRYDTPVTSSDGMFDVNVWGRMKRRDIVRTMVGLYGGRFQGRPHARCLRGRTVRLVPSRPTHLELDGEIFEVTSAEMTVLPKALTVCG